MSARKRSCLIVLGAVLAGLVGIPQTEAQVPSLSPISYHVKTVYRTPGGALVQSDQDSLLVAPTLVDVDHNAATGAAGMDLLVQLQVSPTGATLRTVKLLPVAAPVLQPPTPMPVSVEVTLRDPRPGSPLGVALGYDALAATAPSVVDAAFTVVGTGRGTSFSLDLRTVSPGSTLGITGGVFSVGAGGQRVDPKQGRIDLTPVPGTARIGVTGSELGPDNIGVEITTDTPTRAVAALEDIQGIRRSSIDATIDRVPSRLSMQLTTSAGQRNFTYNASARVARIDALIERRTAGVIQDQVTLGILDMATQATLVQDTPSHATFTANSPIGVVDMAVATGGAVRRLNETNAYVYEDRTGGVSSFAVRLLGLESIEVSRADPFLLDATLASGPFHIRQVVGAETLDAWIRDLPHDIRITFSPSQGTLSYTGSATIGEITADAFDPAGISGRATTLHLLARQLPVSVDVSFVRAAGTFSLDARGGTLGLLEVQLTSGPNDRIDPAFDGILVNDLADRYVLFARVTGLRRIVATQGPPPDIQLDTTGGRIFKLELNELRGTRVEYVRGTLDRLVPSIRVQVLDTPTSKEVVYTASSRTNSLVLDTNSGSRWNLRASISNPLPASIRICAASNEACTGGQSSAAGSLKFTASEHTTVNVFDCVRPLSSSCPFSPSEFTSLNLRVRHFEASAGFASFGFSGHLFMNTTSGGVRHTMNGSLVNRTSSSAGFSANFPTGFWADNRRNEWSFFGLIQTKTGSVNCPPGTSLVVRVLGFDLGVTSFLC